ncbi:hypothetical protein, partial [Streptococcus uberis]|uniref:hypothetical protein n=1 Tax=Streptococcus uberis TaxID=1349 RepID=UPI003D6C2F6A
ALVKQWLASVVAWENDPSLPIPSYNPVTCQSFLGSLCIDIPLTPTFLDKSVNDVKTALEEADRVAARTTPPIHETSATGCLMLGLLVEDMQYVLSSTFCCCSLLSIV